MRQVPSATLVLLGVALAAPLLAGSKREDAQKALKTLTTGRASWQPPGRRSRA